MRLFQLREIEEAYAHAANGGQALHMGGSAAGYPGAPACFRQAGTFAHLIDMNADRLQRTARSLGVRVVVAERPGRRGQHVDLCGQPLRRAIEACENHTNGGIEESGSQGP